MCQLVGVRLFDVYRDKLVGAGKKNLTTSITSQDPGKTLTNRDLESIRQRTVQWLEQTSSVKLRG